MNRNANSADVTRLARAIAKAQRKRLSIEKSLLKTAQNFDTVGNHFLKSLSNFLCRTAITSLLDWALQPRF